MTRVQSKDNHMLIEVTWDGHSWYLLDVRSHGKTGNSMGVRKYSSCFETLPVVLGSGILTLWISSGHWRNVVEDI